MRFRNPRVLATMAVLFPLLAIIVGSCTSTSHDAGQSVASLAESIDRYPASIVWPGTYASDSSKDYYLTPETKNMKKDELLGRDIWFKATAGNERYHSYVIGQRVGGYNMNFWKFLQGKKRATRFSDWGMMNDPDCCTPGEAGCPAKDFNQTYGMDYCPGDDALLAYLHDVAEGKTKGEYRDPACDMPSVDGKIVHSACDLKFGTSAGAIGFRKFPNPKFDPKKWYAIQGNTYDNWAGYDRQIDDGSIEPPFRFGTSCASCHVSFDPAYPAADPNHPKWSNLSGTVGNQYLYISQQFASGFNKQSIEWQMLSNARPGTVDTSAIPNDQVHNPGTVNQIMNFRSRPGVADSAFEEVVDTWRRVESCASGSNEDSCTCNKQGSRCYAKSKLKEPVLHILKGAEDSVGVNNAVMRVYVNIGACSEQCWINHLTDMRVLDSSQRNHGQTPFDIGQCRRDCPSFRALEDRVEMEVAFLLKAGTSDLAKAKGFSSNAELAHYLENERGFGPGAVENGRKIFVQTCARCHSSQKDVSVNHNFYETVGKEGRRKDWLGSDQRINADEVGTFECRAQHSNHDKGHVWDQYSSDDFKNQDPVHNLSVPTTGGKGHYRAISLLNSWAFAPFMHNNAVGPEICSANLKEFGLNIKGTDGKCLPFDPSIEGRLKVFEESMAALLNPATRGKKEMLTTSEIRIPIGPRLRNAQKSSHAFMVIIPKGVTVARVGSFKHKEFVTDLAAAIAAEIPGSDTKADPTQKKIRNEVVQQLARDLMRAKNNQFVLNEAMLKKLGASYSNCLDTIDDKGHTFGAELSDTQKKELTAFMETL